MKLTVQCTCGNEVEIDRSTAAKVLGNVEKRKVDPEIAKARALKGARARWGKNQSK